MTREASRRAFVAGAGLIALAPIASVAAPLVIAPAPGSARLRRAIALHERADAAATHFYERVETPARERYNAAIKAHPVEPPPPHEVVDTTFPNFEGTTVRLSTGQLTGRALSDRVTNDPTWADMGDEDWRQAHRELCAAYARRDAIIADQTQRLERFKEKARKKVRLDEIVARSDALDRRRYALYSSIVTMPVVTIHDLATKLAFIERHEDEPNDLEIEAVFADVKRIAAREGGRA